MKKKILSVVLILSLVLCMFGCGAQKEAPVSQVTLKFMNNEETIGTLTVNAGETVTGYEAFETQEGFDFLGWFETPNFLEMSAVDFTTKTYTEDTTIFGSFKNANVAVDEREWFIVGEGASSVLAASQWAGAIDDADKKACQLTVNGDVVNAFSIDIDLFAGDKFQLIHDWSWDGQLGFGKVTECDASQMESGGGLSGEESKANIAVLMDGNYTITLTTDPENEAMNTFVIVRNGDPEGVANEVITADNYVAGESTSIVMKGSWVDDWSENVEFERVEGNVFSVTKELSADTELYFMVWDNGADTGIGMNTEAVVDDASKALIDIESYNVKVLEDGTYTFTCDADALTITITK